MTEEKSSRFSHLAGKYVLIQTCVPWFATVGQRGKPIMVFEQAQDANGNPVGGAQPRPFPFVRGTVKSSNDTDIVLESPDLSDDSGQRLVTVTVPIQYVAYINEVKEASPIIFAKPS